MLMQEGAGVAQTLLSVLVRLGTLVKVYRIVLQRVVRAAG